MKTKTVVAGLADMADQARRTSTQTCGEPGWQSRREPLRHGEATR
jgi:hypothetical protein